jgi:hypothetical protein
MNTEQAYIEGFVKRASEYGFSRNEAVSLLKQAAPIPMAPGMLRALAPEARALASGEQAAARAMVPPPPQGYGPQAVNNSNHPTVRLSRAYPPAAPGLPELRPLSAPIAPGPPPIRPPVVPSVGPMGRLGRGVADFAKNQIQGFKDASPAGKIGRGYMASKVVTTPATAGLIYDQMNRLAPGSVSPYATDSQVPQMDTNIGY